MRRLLLCLLASGLPIACSSVPPDKGSKAVQSERWATPVKHDANLYRIDVKLGIQSVINLRFFDRNDDDHLKEYGLTLLNHPLLSWSIKPKEIAEILYLIEKQQQNGAVLIHCYHGADRTGLIAGMYRIIYQGWSVEEAKAEMQHGPYGYHSIWKNIANLFTEEKVKQVKTHLEALRKRG